MCGLIGMMAYGEFEDKKDEKVRQEFMMFLLSELLQVTQSRGKDATGISTLFSNCDFMGLKMGVPAQDFVSRFGNTEKDFSGYLNIWRKNKFPSKIVLGHCRKPTVGGKADTNDNNNNHPILVGDIVAVHNGTLTNHERIFKKLDCKRDGNVDSEAIVRLISHYSVNAEPFSKAMIQEICKRLHGSYAVITYNGNNPYQLAAFRDARPLELAIIRPLKLAVLASEKDFLKNALFRYNQMANLYQASASKFISLGKGDVDMVGLDDDLLFLFDLRDDITKDTKISDLYITEKIPRISKLWSISGGTSSVGTSGNPNLRTVTGFEQLNRSAAHGPVVEDDDDDTTDWSGIVKDDKDDDKTAGNKKDNKETTLKTLGEGRVGMAWNRAAGKFDPVNPSKDDTEAFTVIDVEKSSEGEKKTKIPCSDIEVSSQDVGASDSDQKKVTPDKKACDLTETFKAPDDLIADPAKITEVKIIKSVTEKQPKRLPIKDTYTSVTEITMATHPDVIEKSITASKDEMQFSNDGDLCDAIEIADTSTIKSMSLYSLGNRIKNYFFRRGFQTGYVAHENEVAAGNAVRNMLVRSRNKLVSSQQSIRVLKTMVKLLCAVIDKSPDHLKEHNNLEMKAAVAKICSVNTEFSVEQLERVFKKGDTDINPTVQHVMDIIGK